MSNDASDRRPAPGTLLCDVDEFEIEIRKLVAGGDGFGRYKGVPIFVPLSAPGDRLRVRLVQRRPDYGRAEILEVLEPGEGRRAAPCRHFSDCGGCDLQHLEDALQVRYKVAAFRETLERIGGIGPRAVEVVSGAAWGYRIRAQIRIAKRDKGNVVGYFARGSNRLVAISECPILEPRLQGMLPDLRRHGAESRHERLDISVGDSAVTVSPLLEGLPRGEVELTVGEFRYFFDARCFFQSHGGLLPELVERAVGPWRGDSAFDLYAGVGLFSLPLAAKYGGVTAVEGDAVGARFARKNARVNHCRNIEVEHQALESWVGRLPRGASRVLVDPPRGGISRALREGLATATPERLTYVSCHPAALARDLRAWRSVFTIESITLLDMFPQTGHLEAVVQLVAS